MTTNVTSDQARHELKARFRDPVTGAKVRGHKLRETDRRFARDAAAMALPTKVLVEIANATPVQVSTPVQTTPAVEIRVDGESVWHTDRMSHPLYAAA